MHNSEPGMVLGVLRFPTISKSNEFFPGQIGPITSPCRRAQKGHLYLLQGDISLTESRVEERAYKYHIRTM